MRIALTGATGFIGSRLLPRLRAAGWEVRALTRAGRTPARSAGSGAIEWVRGSLADADALQRLVSGADAVIHIAGVVRGRTRDDFLTTNVRGLERLLQAMSQQVPTARLLYFSSLTATQPQLSHYAFSKAQGEALLQDHCALAWTVFRPTAVYGPGDHELLPLFEIMRRGLAVMPGHNGLLSFVEVDDVVSATLTWLQQGDLEQQIFEIHDGHLEGYDWAQIVAIMQTFARRRIRRLELSRRVLAPLARANLWLSGITGRAPMLTPQKLNELFHLDWRCGDTRFAELTGWAPRYALASGLAATFDEIDRADPGMIDDAD